MSIDMDLIEILKILGDENRIRILNILKENPLCVCEIESILDLNQSNVSRHLMRLNSSKLIKNYKKAQFTYYTLNDELLSEHNYIKDVIYEETKKLDYCREDLKTLALFKDNNINCENLNNKQEIVNSLKSKSKYYKG